MKNPSINSETEQSVNLPAQAIADAELLALDERTILALVDIIFSQREPDDLPS